MLKLKKRVLLNSGISLITEATAADIILNKGNLPKHFKVLKCESSEKYDLLYKENTTFNEDDYQNIVPEIKQPQEKDLQEMLLLLSEKRDETDKDQHDARVSSEIRFFSDNNLMPFLFSCYHLITRFREGNVVWGVGRGSSCASYILFLLGVHDVNPIKYNISFGEFSKES